MPKGQSEDNKGAIRRYRRDNQKIPKGQSEYTKEANEKVQKDEQRSTKYTYETKDRVTRTPLKSGDELMCSGRISTS